jgi:hypothetical protein
MGKRTMAARVNRKVVSVTSLHTPDSDKAYWHAQTPAARMSHLEFLRRLNYGEVACSGRLKRVLEVAQLEKS